MNSFQQYMALSRYARYLEQEGRRETWEETVARYMDNVVGPVIGRDGISDAIGQAITNMEVLPSMRALMTAGPALDRDNVAAYNCAYGEVDHPRIFDEAIYILMCGTGLGFSVERQYVNKLPEVPELNKVDTTIVVEDSKRGWAKALRKLIGALYAGDIPKYDLSLLRPHGARLKIFGGRASGPEPLRRLFDFVIATFKAAEGRKLTSYECHRIMCKIGESVVSGGVRRSALISLSNLSDDRMRHAKDGRWFDTHPELSLANNSIAYTERPEFDAFLREWVALNESKSGERGIFNREASDRQVASNRRRKRGFRWGTNPCSEIILRANQFCNLSSVVVRTGDDLQTLLRKVELATILGTIQSTFTDFAYLRPIWKRNCEEERLLGVSLTGIMDHEVLSQTGPEAVQWLTTMRAKAIATNAEWAAKLGINQSTAITCVKPEGTVSQLTNSSSGIHPRWSKYYLRRYRADNKDPLSDFLKLAGVPWENDLVQPEQVIFEFPIESPDGSIYRSDMTAIQQLEHWKMLQEHWCEHKPSVTIYYSEDEFLGVGQWVWDNFDIVSGVSFMPRDNGSYMQAPYEELTKEEYEERIAKFPTIHWDLFKEDDDYTTASQSLACVAGACEL